eukprot:361753-Chlamydomonas_euryale.AAC.1
MDRGPHQRHQSGGMGEDGELRGWVRIEELRGRARMGDLRLCAHVMMPGRPDSLAPAVHLQSTLAPPHTHIHTHAPSSMPDLQHQPHTGTSPHSTCSRTPHPPAPAPHLQHQPHTGASPHSTCSTSPLSTGVRL